MQHRDGLQNATEASSLGATGSPATMLQGANGCTSDAQELIGMSKPAMQGVKHVPSHAASLTDWQSRTEAIAGS